MNDSRSSSDTPGPQGVSLDSPALPAEVRALLEHLLEAVERPVPLDEWRDLVIGLYRGKAKTTRLRMAQALAETLELAGPGATTSALDAGLVARLATRAGRASTTDGLLSSLRAACRLAVKRRWLLASRLDGACWNVPETEGPRRKHHPRRDVRAVLDGLRARSDTWEGGRLHALAAVYAYTGLRRTEALRLRVEDIDLARGFVFIRPNGKALKTAGSKAPVPCPRALVEVLGAWLPRCGSDWVFPARNRRSPWTGGTTGKRPTDRLVAAGRAAGVEGFTPLSLRHSLATHLASHWGLTAKQIQMVLRHTTEATQDHYIHPDLVNLGALVREFGYDAARPRGGAHCRVDPRHDLLARRKRFKSRFAAGAAATR